MQVMYQGPHRAVDVMVASGRQVRVERGGTADLPDAIAEDLLRRPHWRPVLSGSIGQIEGLSEEQVEALRAGGFKTVEQLRAASDRDLRAVHGIGKAAITAIRSAVGHQPG